MSLHLFGIYGPLFLDRLIGGYVLFRQNRNAESAKG